MRKWREKILQINEPVFLDKNKDIETWRRQIDKISSEVMFETSMEIIYRLDVLLKNMFK